LRAIDPHSQDVWTGFGLEDHSRDAPFEIAHDLVGVLVDLAFGEDVDPAVATTGVEGRGWEGIEAVGGVSEFRS